MRLASIPVEPLGRRLHQGQAVGRGGDVAQWALLPRVVGDDEQHPVERQRLARPDGRCHVAHVGRVEGPAQEAEALARGRVGSGHEPVSLEAGHDRARLRRNLVG